MRKLAFALVSTVGLSIYGSAALADAAPAAPAPATPAANPADLDPMVCRTMPPPTGSRLGTRRECRTQREWDDIRLQSQKETTHMQGTTLGPKSN